MSTDLFQRYATTIANLPSNFDSEQPLPASLRITGDGRHEIYYAPFDHVNTAAKVVLVGITPGRVQAVEAIRTAARCLQNGLSEAEARARAKTAASFAGPMRSNLVNLLDHVGLAARLGLQSTAELWSTRSDLAHFTSALRYPVFAGAKNFSGSGLLRSPLLREQLETWFVAECEALPQALFVPLGSAADAACQHLVTLGKLNSRQVLSGLPHPSGANAERIAYFLGRKARQLLSAKTVPAPLDAGRERATAIVAAWNT